MALAAEDFPPLTASLGPCRLKCPAPLPRAWARVLRGHDAPADEPAESSLPAWSGLAPKAEQEAQDQEGAARSLAVAAAESALPEPEAQADAEPFPSEATASPRVALAADQVHGRPEEQLSFTAASPRSCPDAGDADKSLPLREEPESSRQGSDASCVPADAWPSPPSGDGSPSLDNVSASSADCLDDVSASSASSDSASSSAQADAATEAAAAKERAEPAPSASKPEPEPSWRKAEPRPFAVIRDRPGPKIPGRSALRQAPPDHFRLSVPRRSPFPPNQRRLGRSHTAHTREYRREGPEEHGAALWLSQRTKSMDDQSSSGQSSVSWQGPRGGHRTYGTKSSYFTVNNWLWESSEDVPSPASNSSDLSSGQSGTAMTPFVLGTDLLTFIKLALKQQIEYYFSVENLSGDMYLRSHMDHDGFVHVDVIACFNRVRWYCAKTDFILEAMESSDIVQVQGSLMRCRRNWSRWVLPSAESPSPQSSILEDTGSDSPDLSLASD